MNKKTIIVSFLLWISLLAFITYCLVRKNNSLIDQRDAVMHFSDSIFYYKDKNNRTVAQIELLKTKTVNQFLELRTKDSIIQELQNEVRRNKRKIKDGGSVTIFETETKFDTIIPKSYKDSTSFQFRNDWINFQYYTQDSTQFELKVKNEYAVLIGKDDALFRKPRYYVEVTNKNPYSETKTLRTYQVDYPTPSRFGIGIQTGITYDGHVKPYIGIGIQYTILSF